MDAQEPKQPDDLLERATAALRDLPMPDGPPAQVLEQTLNKIRATQSARWRLTMKSLVKLSMAAVIAVLFLGLFFWSNPPWGAHVAFADVIERVKQAKAVRFKFDNVIQVPNMPPQRFSYVTVMTEDHMRQEYPGVTSVMDLKQGRGITLDERQKKATVINLKNMPAQAKQFNLLEEIRTMHPKEAKAIGQKVIAGSV